MKEKAVNRNNTQRNIGQQQSKIITE